MGITNEQSNYYLNFVLHSIIGNYSTAENIFERYHNDIKKVANVLITIHEPWVDEDNIKLYQTKSLANFNIYTEDSYYACYDKKESIFSLPNVKNLLFYWRWGIVLNFERQAKKHPDINEDRFLWNLATQKPVIMENQLPLKKEELLCLPKNELKTLFNYPY